MVRDVRRDAVSCGLGNVIGNKGAVGVSFEYAGARMCFLNAHLAAHAENVAQRNADYHRVVKTMFAPRGREKGKPRLVKKQAPGKVKKNAVAPAPAFAEDVPGDSPIDSRARRRPAEIRRRVQAARLERRGPVSTCACSSGTRTTASRQPPRGGRPAGARNAGRDARERPAADRAERGERSRVVGGEIEFPPTHKVDAGHEHVRHVQEAARPSWTDRVMWRTAGEAP